MNQRWLWDEMLSELINDEHHKTMRKQILMSVFPFGNEGTDLALVIRAVILLFVLQNF